MEAASVGCFRALGIGSLRLLWIMGLAAAGPAQAQYYSFSGAVSSYPTNFFPINPAAPVLDLTGNTLSVGNSAPGSFTAMAGAMLKADTLALGNGGNGNGTGTITGAGTQAQLAGSGNRLDVGSWGTGSLTISSGAVVDATGNAGACLNNFCNNFVGNGAGSSGTLAVTGTGSELRLLRNFGVGQASVFTQAQNGFDFGTPGGTTHAAVNVTAGGILRSQAVAAGVGPNSVAALGSEKAFATITVSGPGSQWIATRNTVDNAAASFVAGRGVGGDATINIANGGKLIVDGTGGSATSFDAMVIGANGGRGKVTVTGAGSTLQVTGNNPYLGVGRSGATGEGTLNVLDGASASALLFGVGRDGATGTLLVDGVGSLLSMTGVGTTGTAGPAGGTIGQNGGNGTMTVSGGGRVLISDGGADSRAAGSSPFLNVGLDPSSSGKLTITGAGSRLEMTSTSLGLPVGAADNYNPFMSVGRLAGSNGELVVSAGGKLLLQGNALSSVANTRLTSLQIGGAGDTVPGGTGTALVTGAGSEIRVEGADALILVGRAPGSNGTLTIADQGSVTATGLVVGRATGATGTLAMNRGTLSLSGQETGDALVGAFLAVGSGNGTGTATIANGSTVNITNLGSAGASLVIGGSALYPGGTGTLSVSGGSQINITAAGTQATVSVGRNGTGTGTGSGTATFEGGSTLNVGAGSVYVGRAGSTGTLHLEGGSVINAGYVGIGQTQAGAGGTGNLILDNSTVNATTVYIGAGGTLSGDNGVINATGDVTVAGTITPGHSPSRVNINCNFITLAGSRLILDVLDIGGGFDVDHLILGNDSTFDLSKIQLVFNFLGDADPTAFAASGGFDLDNFLQSLNLETGEVSGLSTVFAAGITWADIFSSSQFVAVSDTYDVSNLRLSADGTVTFSAAAVPEPGTWALMLFGLGMLGWAARRRR